MSGAGCGDVDAARLQHAERAVAVVVVDASVGGLEACLTLLHGLPARTGLAIVLLLQTEPALVEECCAALAGQVAMPVLPAEDGMAVQADAVLVVPWEAPMVLRDRRLNAVAEPAGDALELLMRSLAETEGARGIAVLLSADAARIGGRLDALRQAGGWVMAQLPEGDPPMDPADQADQDPARGDADQALPLAVIGGALAAWAAGARRALPEDMLQAIPLPVAVLDGRRRIVAANAGFRMALGVTPERLEAALLAAPRLDAFLTAAHGLPGEVEDSILEVAQQDGETRLLRVSARRLSADPPRSVLTIEDLTERTRLAGRLELAKAVAERADREKSRFLAAASHDLRQPLQSMSMLHGLLAAKAADPTLLRLIGRLDETIDAMSGILDALLDINRMEVGRVHADIAPVPVGSLLSSLDREFADAARAAGLDWRMVPSDAVVLSDARLLRQILRNLLSNALKYTRQGRILVGCRRIGGHLRIEVWDTGIGIPQAQMQAVFEEFHQISNTARARSQGLGLGLAIARRLANLLGHPIGVRSREHAGSCFHVDLPLAQGAALLPQDMPPPPSEAARILVIEDDRAVADALRMLLQEQGYLVSVAFEGSRAIALAVENPPALVITDYNLPGNFSGVDLTLQLRQVLAAPPAAIILSGDTSARTRQEIGLLDVEHSPKPIRADDLLARVRRLLAARTPAPDVGEAVGPDADAFDVADEDADEPAPDAASADEPVAAPANGAGTAGGNGFARGAAAQPEATGSQVADTQINGPRVTGQVFIVDDDATLRRDTAEWLAANGLAVESFATAEAFLQADHPARRGCVLVDAVMPGMDGVALLAALRPHAQRLPAIMVTGHGDVRMAVRAMTAGAMDFIEKPIVRSDLLRSIATASARISQSIGEAAIRAEVAARLEKLTPRQRQILDRVIAGSPSKIIAAELRLNQRTVENHRAAIMAKIGARSLPELIRKVVSAGNQQG
ncbi:response regulator [Roseomonas frigidaquae]|uniref:histidine kinase n=1 Tax=Falsiroseomonas frigidaquae TaxID=487318 RepID=A0ABX1EZG9_9PROT|nr:response regulator [Falsiroseomonas frigidaquae]NKE45448.1 response regulator [Falsiroseomonas frigidaquae]